MTPFPFQVCQSQTTLVDVQLQPVVCCACVEILVVVSTIPQQQAEDYHTHLDSLLLEFSL